MTTRRDHLKLLAAAGAAALAGPMAAFAQGTVHEVQMLNADPENPRERQVFVPDLLRAQPGDTIRFIAVDRGHNSAADEDMIPEGGTTWEGAIGEDVEVTIDVDGAYGYHCVPHASAGMVGLILVGDVAGNYEALKEMRMRGKAADRYESIFARADEMLAAEA